MMILLKLLLATEEKIFPPKKKPTKYTKEGLFDAMSLLGFVDPWGVSQAYTVDKLKKQKADKKFQRRRKYVEGYTDIATQLMQGTGNFIQSASEFVLTPIDYVFTTDFQDKFNDYMDKSLSFAADEPETLWEIFLNLLENMLFLFLLPLKLKMVQCNGVN
jgi:hypothetical protein